MTPFDSNLERAIALLQQSGDDPARRQEAIALLADAHAAHAHADARADPRLAAHDAFFRLASVGLAEADPLTRRFVDVNEAFCGITGYRRDQLLQMTFCDLTHPDDRPADLAAMSAMLAGQAHYLREKRYVRQDGRTIWVQVNVTMIPASPLRPARTAAVIVDITARRQLETAMSYAKAQAEVARVAAERANHDKDRFLSIVSHELRNPLNALLAVAQTLSRQMLPPEEWPEAAGDIERHAWLMARLIDDLLDHSRITHGKLRIDCRRVDLTQVIHGAADAMREPIAGKGLRLHVTADGEAMVLGDAQRLTQVMCNLLGNAVKFTPTGGSISVRLHRDSAAVRVEITDSGCGIDPAFLPHVFDAFSQSGHTLNFSRSGLGLGLAIVRSLVELHGGQISASSGGLNQGSTFTLTLPLA